MFYQRLDDSHQAHSFVMIRLSAALQRLIFSGAPAMLEAGIVYGGVCVSVRLSAQNLENYWSEIDVTWQKYVPW